MVGTHFQVHRAVARLRRFWRVGDSQPADVSLRVRLDDCASVLEQSHQELAERSSGRRAASPAAEWLLDNRAAIREQIRLARGDLRSGHAEHLPRPGNAGQRALPRVYHLARGLAARTDHELDAAGVRDFVNAYQARCVLTRAELWALPAMLRLALLEKLGEFAARAAAGWRGPGEPALHDGEVADDPRHESERAAIAAAIASLRSLGTMDWKELVASTSAVERTLRRDPAGAYGRMTFDGRNYYQGIVAKLARGSGLAEERVAEFAVALARQGPGPFAAPAACTDLGPEAARRHVGYYLMGRGRPVLEKQIAYRPALGETICKSIARHAVGAYCGGILFAWLSAMSIAATMGWRMGVADAAGPAGSLALFLLAAGGMGHLAVTVVDWLCGMLVAPKPIVRMDFSAGIPSDCRTLVAVPTMLTGEQGVSALLHQLELRFLANRDENLTFALITDFPDADRAALPGDCDLLSAARQGIERLNRRYRNAFYLLHRPRLWNAQEGAWMGCERKRGKLSALNRLLRSGDASAFQATVGDLGRLASVRYVVTLDSDTRLPRDAVRELAGCMAHPLNRPGIDARTRVVTEGHAVLQPRVTAAFVDAQRSPFSRLLAGDAGIDPYTHQTSLVYQDVFDEGSFIGKGIYDVRAWEAAVEGRFPDNRILSHDLIEGCFARSGFVGDVELFESVPCGVLADASRRHRWIRGDWQVAAWLFGGAPSAKGRCQNALSRLSRWKIGDNLRRSLTPVFLFSLLALGWTLVPRLAGFWTCLAAAIMFGPAACMAGLCFLRKIEGKPWKRHVVDEAKTCLRAVAMEAVSWCILPYTAYYHLDAIVRALYRLHVSRRLLLEWTTASDAEARSQTSCREHYERMWTCTIAAVGMAALLLILQPVALAGAGPALVAWLLGPMIAWSVSQPSRSESPRFTDEERLRLGRWARQTWRYFETNTGRRTHWLPPDNLQEYPRPTVASRTSPTNIGLGLLANLAACDLGYVTPPAMFDRTARTLHSMLHLEQYHGHFYNWYDTNTLRPAEPRYVSSVDSGNLWAALIVLHAGAGEMRNRPLAPPRLIDGVRETLAVIAEVSGPLRGTPAGRRFEARFAQCRACCDRAAGGKARDACRTISGLHRRAVELAAAVPGDLPDVGQWTRALVGQCAAGHRDLCRLAFWTHLPAIGTGGRSLADQFADPVLTARQRTALEGIGAAIEAMDEHCTLGQLPDAAARIAEEAESLLRAGPKACLPRKLDIALSRTAAAARQAAAAAIAELRQITRVQDLCRQFCAMDFRFLYNAQRKLLAIGYNASQDRRDEGCYDLLASEARMTSFLAVSHGQLPLEHWFALGRMVTMAAGQPALLSWSGSMFEHLMPTLIMPSYRGSFLDLSCRAAVRRQMDYARRLGIPWGISESSYNAINPDAAYGYRAFGVPGLGLERGLGENLVVAPYASALAMTIAPREAIENLAGLERRGYLSSCGFYDAVDYTPGRDLAGQPAPCRIVMAHHSGMMLLALVNTLVGRRMEQRFLNDGLCEAHDLLLQERLPKAIRPVNPENIDAAAPSPERRARLQAGRSNTARLAEPELPPSTPNLPVGYGAAETDRTSPARLSGTD